MRPLALLPRTLLSTFAALLVLSGCAAGAETPSPAPRADRNLITREEMAGAGANNLHEVVQRLRPHWLRPPQVTSIRGGGMAPVVVYQGNTRLGGEEVLRQMSPGYAVELRFLDGSQASNTLPGIGSRPVMGAIVIVLPS